MSATLNRFIINKVNAFKNLSFRKISQNYSTVLRSNISENNLNINESSLEKRILSYLKIIHPANNVNYKISKDNNLSINVNALNNDKLLTFISDLPEQISQKELQKYLKTVDLECRKRLPQMKLSEIFQFLYTFVNVVPYYVKNLPFYNQAIHKMSFSVGHCSKSELVQLCFYTGLKKKSFESQQILKHCLNKLNSMQLDKFSLEDVIIICNAAFKTSTRITQKKFLEEIKYRIFNQLNILNDESFFITIVKSLRHNYNYDEELLITIKNTMFFNKIIPKYNFTAISHILTLYADALYYDTALINALNERCITYLQNTKTILSKSKYLKSQIRLKDVSRYLWSFSYLGYELNKDIINCYIIPILKDYMKIEDVERNIEDFVGILLSLWIIGHCPCDILPVILKNKSLLKGRHKKTFVARLNLLLTSIEYENKEVFDSLNITPEKSIEYNLNAQIIRRTKLPLLYKSLKNLSTKFNIGVVEYSFRIPHINIAGITVYDKNKNVKLFIELVDDMTSVKYSQEILPHGFMKLKIRLLQSLKKPLLVIDEDEISELTQPEIDIVLGRKLKKMFL